ncbi:MAG: histidine phosphatase family protein [Rhodospirillaceae bacterium]|nr:histidine phosphatase family protein [Rhodospirillaceae bacterium]
MTRLAVMRHAATAWSAARRLQGRTDLPLSEAGRAAAARLPLPPPIDRFVRVSSPLARARETAALLRPVAPFSIEPRLIEMDFGAWEGRTLAEIRAADGAGAARREAMGLDFRAPGGESPREVQARLLPWLVALGGRGEDTLAVTHKAVIRALYALATGWPMLGRPPQRLEMDRLHLLLVAPDGAVSVGSLNLPPAAATAED